MASRPVLPIRTRSGRHDVQTSDLSSRDVTLVNRFGTRPAALDDAALSVQDESESEWQDIDPFWKDASNVHSLRSFLADVEKDQHPDSALLSGNSVDPGADERALDVNREGEEGSHSPSFPTASAGLTSTQVSGPDAQGDLSGGLSRTRRDPESTDEVSLRLSNQFTPVVEPDWDTVVYIGPPTQQRNQNSEEYEYIKQHFSRPYLMKSQTLRASGSAELADRLGPKSARTMRKLKNIGLHHALPANAQPKYWVDLRPMQNDDEAAQTVSELTCTPGILNWHKLGVSKAIDRMVIGGKDRMDIPFRISQGIELPAGFFSENAAALRGRDSGGASAATAAAGTSAQQEDEDLELDYSPLRHHSAIERLLHALAGNSPRLNSAPKMWAFFAVARMLDCARHIRVADEICSWIFAGYNSEFIEANPEVCYRIAMGIQNKMLLRVTFSILVGERAMKQALSHSLARSTPAPIPSRTRLLSFLDDDEDNRIDHAARSLTRRVGTMFDKIIRLQMTWMIDGREIFKLLALVGTTVEADQALTRTWSLLFDHVHCEIIQALVQSVSDRYTANGQRRPGGARVFSADAISQYNHLPLPQRLLSQISWEFISTHAIYQDNGSLAAAGPVQWDGLADIAPAHDLDLERYKTNRPKFEIEMSLINRYISTGLLRYRNVPEQDPNSHDYEVRWDAVYSAALGNLDAVSKLFTPVEHAALRPMITQRETFHRREVSKYDAEMALHHARNSGETTARTASADKYYTSAKVNSWNILSQTLEALKAKIKADALRPGYLRDASGIEADISVTGTDTLLCLDEDEFKFLPLWADGCDDGTGGVYTDPVPGAVDEVFTGGKRGLDDDDGLQGLEDIEMGESFSVIDTAEAESTVVGASRVATAGMGTDSVMSLDE